jgi:hypothetical protein
MPVIRKTFKSPIIFKFKNGQETAQHGGQPPVETRLEILFYLYDLERT